VGAAVGVALASSYAELTTKDRFMAAWFRPRNDVVISDVGQVPRWDQFSSKIVWETEAWIHAAHDRLFAHVVFAARASEAATVKHTLRLDASAGDTLDTDVGGDFAPNWGPEVTSVGTGYWEALVTVEIPGGSSGTRGDIELFVELSSETSSAAPLYALQSVTVWGSVDG